jgi:hypothetical protein
VLRQICFLSRLVLDCLVLCSKDLSREFQLCQGIVCLFYFLGLERRGKLGVEVEVYVLS